MPWYNGDYPPSYKHQPVAVRNKAVEIANELLLHGAPEGVAIATGLKRARQFFEGAKGSIDGALPAVRGDLSGLRKGKAATRRGERGKRQG